MPIDPADRIKEREYYKSGGSNPAAFIILSFLNTVMPVSHFVIIPCPVWSIDRTGFLISIFRSALDFRHLGLLIPWAIHFLVIFRSMILWIIGTRSSHACFCHNNTSCLSIVSVFPWKLYRESQEITAFLLRMAESIRQYQPDQTHNPEVFHKRLHRLFSSAHNPVYTWQCCYP